MRFYSSFSTRKNKCKKRILLLLVALFMIIISLVSALSMPIVAEESITNSSQLTQEEQEQLENLEKELQENINSQIADLDLTALENYLNSLTDQERELFGGSNIIQKLEQIVSGEFSDDTSSLWQALLNLIFDELLAILPFIASIIAIAVLAGLLADLKGNSQSIGDIIHFVCYGVIIVIIATAGIQMISLTSNTLTLIVTQIEIIFPLLLTLLTDFADATGRSSVTGKFLSASTSSILVPTSPVAPTTATFMLCMFCSFVVCYFFCHSVGGCAGT